MPNGSASGVGNDGTAPDRLTDVFQVVARRIAGGEGPLTGRDLDEIRQAGTLAAEEGMTARAAVDLYLASAAAVWETQAGKSKGTEPATGHAVLTAIRVAVPVLVQGYENAGQTVIREEEAARAEFIDDLLRGDADVAGMVQRAEPFGLDLSASHHVVLAVPRSGPPVNGRDLAMVSRVVVDRYGDHNVLVASKANQIVAVMPWGAAGHDVDEPARQLSADMGRADPRRRWRFAVGRPHAGAYGVAHSYQQAREAMALVERLPFDEDVVLTRDLLIYRVLGRDRAALADLVEDVLTPLARARGGAGPLIDTLEAYFAASEVATEAARLLHVSVRTVTYRLAKVTDLTGYDPGIPTQRLTLQAAVIGARLLPWPETHRPTTAQSSGS